MSIQTKIKTAARVFALPKDWKAKGNMEFDELLSIALFHKEVAEQEICTRFNYWYREYHKAQGVIIILVVLLAASLVTCYIEWHNSIVMYVVASFIGITITGIGLARRRAKVIDDRLLHCYYWIIAEILHPAPCQDSRNQRIERLFIVKLSELEEQEHKAGKKFRRLVRNFGYTNETIQQ